MLIGIAGAAGSGKDSVAEVLCKQRGFNRVSLADPVKEACAAWFGWSREQLWGPSELRNQPDPAWEGLTPRLALQQLGTEFGRAMHPDVWVRLALARAAELENCCIPDVRFPNEVAAIRAAGGRVVCVERPAIGTRREVWRQHASEQQALEFDLRLPNAGSLLELQQAALQLPERLFPG